VSFNHRADAQRAMDRLNGYGYDHLILKLEWAKPSVKEGGGGGGGGGGGEQFRSGYGKALAQDTTEKVSYASNLTSGTSAIGNTKF
jgi:translation initiation factor 3 subunit G